MVDQVAAKKALQELIKSTDLNNKVCNDCPNPNPQWASISFAVFLCLQCAGTHRGFGVHISFVRSVSMDTWQPDQLKRMQIGGNAPFKQFMQSYVPADTGGYRDGLSSYEIYHCWAATQYRGKIDADLAGKPWSPSAPPEGLSRNDSNSSINRPSSAQGLRKARTSTTTGRPAGGSSLRSGSPASFTNSPRDSPDPSFDQRTANESFFLSLGQANASRPDDLLPSQGGRYQGFGSTSSPVPSDQPSFRTSSANAPTLGELQENPMAALSKGWSIFSAAVAATSRVVSENVIQPGVEKVMDPNLQANVGGYLSEAQKQAQLVGSSANHWTKNQFGIDVADSVGGVYGTVRDKIGGGPARSGYGSLAQANEEETSLYHDDTDDLFKEYNQGNSSQRYDQPPSNPASKAKPSPSKADDLDEGWQDF